MVKAPRHWKQAIRIYVYSLFIIAFSYEFGDDSNSDLVRYFIQLEQLQGLSLKETAFYFNDGLFTEHILFWLIAQLRIPHLLPAVTTSIVYLIGAYITYDMATEIEIRECWKIIAAQLIIIPLFTVAANVRNIFSFSIVSLAIYRDLGKSKRNISTVILYLIGIFMHKTGIVLVLLRILVPICKKAIILTIGLVFSLPIVINFTYSHIYLIPFKGTIGSLLRRLVFSAYNYLLGAEGSGAIAAYAQRLESSLGNTANRIIIFSFSFGLFSLYLWKYFKTKKLTDFQVYGYLTCVITLASHVIDTSAYWRFCCAESLVMAPVFLDLIENRLFSRRTTNYISFFVVLFFCLRFAIHTYRVKGIFTSPIIINVLLTNAYTIFFQILRSVILY